MPSEDDQPHLRRCLALRAAGDLIGALQAAREASAVEPHAAIPYYAQGEICTALADDAGAVTAYAEALRRAPGWADAWINLGLAHYRQGRIGAAKAAMHEALRRAPGHPGATGNLAAFMRITGEAETAETLLRAALAITPDNTAARLNLAAELLHSERAAEALALLQAAPSPVPQWHLAHTLALLQLRHTAAARAALAALGPMPPELAPLLHWRHVLLAAQENNRPRALAAAQAMAAAIAEMGPHAVPEHRIMAHYDLAQFHSGLGNTSTAFTHWSHGHALLRQAQPFSRTRFREFLDSSIAAFPAARFAGARATNRDPAPVFITGMPRSGTTLCEQILAAHPLVHGAGERDALACLAEQLGGPARITALAAPELDAAAKRYLDELHALAPGKTRIVDKMPGNELHLGLVALMLPGARIIHCTRDPRDIGFSIWTFRFHGEHPYAHDLADLGWTIAQRARLMAHWRTALPMPILTVALQNWVQDFAGTLARVLAHLGLPPDPACARFYESNREIRTVSRAQIRQPVNAKGLGRWRPYEQELAPLIAELKEAGMI